jgi:hypothetical protein
MKFKKDDDAISEIFGAILLMGIVVCFISALYLSVLSDPGPTTAPIATIVGKINDGDVYLDHRSGESLSSDTEIILNLAGYRQLRFSPSQLINDGPSIDEFWDIGERLIYSQFDLTDLRVEASVIDRPSENIIMWGVLQDGYVINNPGGIWHLNDNIGNTAEDVLNDNTGYLEPDGIFGPQWNSEEKIDGASSLRFDGIDDYVIVDGDSVSLDILDSISIESWIKLPEDNVLNNFKYGPNFGYEPNVIHVANNVYAIVYRDQQEEGILKSVSVYPDGTIIGNIHNNSLEFSKKCYWPKIIHISDEAYLIAYSQSDTNPKNVYLKTVKMLDNGTTVGVLGEFTFEQKEVDDYQLLKIDDNLSVIVYRNVDGQGFVRTIRTTNNCSIINTSLINGILNFENNSCNEPSITYISNDTYAITYRGDNDRGYLKTISITDDGEIYNKSLDVLIFEVLDESFESQIINVVNNTYAIVYRDNSDKGYITTVEIMDNGTINKIILDSIVFESDYCLLPDITHMKEDIFLVAYEYLQKDGYVIVAQIQENGVIKILDKFQFNTKKNYFGIEPDIFRVSDDVFGIAFRSGSQVGVPHEGHLITGRISKFVDSDDPNNFGAEVIYREGIYGIFVNETHITATIGENILSSEISLNTDYWTHIVLTYDNSVMRLYINGIEENSEILNENIVSTTNNIFFGRSFFGIIDEIGIFGKALSSSEVNYHYSNPGDLESSLS